LTAWALFLPLFSLSLVIMALFLALVLILFISCNTTLSHAVKYSLVFVQITVVLFNDLNQFSIFIPVYITFYWHDEIFLNDVLCG